MLKSLTAILWQAFRQTVHPVTHAASLVNGRTLAGKHVETNTIKPRQNNTVELLAQQYQDLGSAPLNLQNKLPGKLNISWQFPVLTLNIKHVMLSTM